MKIQNKLLTLLVAVILSFPLNVNAKNKTYKEISTIATVDGISIDISKTDAEEFCEKRGNNDLSKIVKCLGEFSEARNRIAHERLEKAKAYHEQSKINLQKATEEASNQLVEMFNSHGKEVKNSKKTKKSSKSKKNKK